MAKTPDDTITMSVEEWDRLVKEFKASDADIRELLRLERENMMANLEAEAVKEKHKEAKAKAESTSHAVHKHIRGMADPQGKLGFAEPADEDDDDTE